MAVVLGRAGFLFAFVGVVCGGGVVVAVRASVGRAFSFISVEAAAYDDGW